MWGYLRDIFVPIFRWTGNLTMSQWFLIFMAVVIVGVFCLRGFGSRSDY